MKHNNLYSGLVTPSSGWWSPIEEIVVEEMASWQNNKDPINLPLPPCTVTDAVTPHPNV